jgi:hypothetical protein
MSYRIAGIDVHKRMLAVVVADWPTLKSKASTSLNSAHLVVTLSICDCWPNG